MISGRMARPLKVISGFLCLTAASLGVAACGTQKISVPRSNAAAYTGAVLFSQRCAGCHTLSYAGTHGSAANNRDRQPINGPNFNVRCERPVDRVLYAIENGGFSGAYMPQNIVVGEQAREVAVFISEYAGRQAPTQPGETPCARLPIGSLPAATATGLPVVQTVTSSTTSPSSAAGTSTGASTTSTGTSTTGTTTSSSGGAAVSGGTPYAP
jgi:mono/diheme cytochrome c family protein